MASPALAPPSTHRAFLAPRLTISGSDAVTSVGETLRDQGVPFGPVAVVGDAVVTTSGLADGLLAGLEEAGYAPVLVAEIDGEPADDVVDRAADVARGHEVRAVVGIGGGSALDVAKLVALLACDTGRTADRIGVLPASTRVAPLVLVPTTTGTGAEVTRIAMVGVGGSKKIVSCPSFVPLVAVIDPDLVAGLPAAVVAATGMDALSHAVESMLSNDRGPTSMLFAERAIETIVRCLKSAAIDGDRSARGELLYAAHFAGLALNAGVVLGHSLAYVIARHHPLPHGTTCALALPYCLAYDQAIPADLAKRVALLLTDGASRDLSVAAGAVDELAKSIGLPRSLAEVSIDETQLRSMAEETVRDYPRPTNPVPLEPTRLESLLGHMQRGDVSGAWAAMKEGGHDVA